MSDRSTAFRVIALLFIFVGIVAFASRRVSGMSGPVPPGDDGLPTASLSLQGTVLSVNGLIGAATLHAIDQLLAVRAVHTLRMWSGGGDTTVAQALAARLNAKSIRLEVGPNAVCSSACVILLAETRPQLRSIDGAAWLRVHGASAGPRDPEDDDSPEGGMAPWVRTLSSNWFAYLADCPSRPLVRNAGLAMTWSEVQAIDAAAPAPACADIAFRTKTWLFKRF